jgi:hypothetical protein
MDSPTKSNGVNEKDMMLKTRERELPIFVKVLKAYPKDKGDFKPHEMSRSGSELAFTLATEQMLAMQGLTAGKIDGAEGSIPAKPDSFDEIISIFEKNYNEVQEKIKALSEEELNAEMSFFGNKMRKMDLIRLMIMDGVHHRGQFSVYIRMAGGKVPAMYGPSADEPYDAAK